MKLLLLVDKKSLKCGYWKFSGPKLEGWHVGSLSSEDLGLCPKASLFKKPKIEKFPIQAELFPIN